MESDKPKRYKLPLGPAYSKRQVSELTHANWTKRAKSLTEEGTQTAENSVKAPTPGVHYQEMEYLPQSSYEKITYQVESEKHQLDDFINIEQECTLAAKEEADDISDNCSDTSIAQETDTINSDSDSFENESSAKIHTRLIAENRVMFKEYKTTVGDVAEMISAFFCRFGIVLEARLKLFEMFRICAGPEFDNFKISNYMFSKVYDPRQEKVKLHFYCTSLLVTGRDAFSKEKMKELICNKCSEQYQLSLGSSNSFQIIDLHYQIGQLLKRPEVAKAFFDKVKSQKTSKVLENIGDVDGGEIHRNIVEKHPNVIPYTVATDGATAKNPLKCKTGFWPLQILFPALPLSTRFKLITLVGVMILRKEPSPELLNLFLQSFVDQAIELSKEDVLVVIDGALEHLQQSQKKKKS